MFNHEELKVFFRDKIVDFKDGSVSISCTGFMYGLAVFTGMRAHYNEKLDKLYIFRPADHYDRFCFQCGLFRYKNFLENFPYERFLSVIVDLFRVNKIREDAYIRASNFSDENRVTPKFVGYKDSFCAFLYPIGNYVPVTGMRCKVSSWPRVDDNAIPSRAKANGLYVNTAFAKTEALLGGFDEALFVDGFGHVVEGSAENIFIYTDGTLVTPPKSDAILDGITRMSVMDLAKDEGIAVVERSIGRSELYRAQEVFLTGTGAQVAPVIEIDNYPVGTGSVGPISAKFQKLYFDAVRGDIPRYHKWLVDVDAA